MEAKPDVGGNAGGNVGMQDFRYALRKFCKDCEQQVQDVLTPELSECLGEQQEPQCMSLV